MSRRADDEPTKLPGGTEVELLSLDDAIDPDERARLLQSIEDGFADILAAGPRNYFARLKTKDRATKRLSVSEGRRTRTFNQRIKSPMLYH